MKRLFVLLLAVSYALHVRALEFEEIQVTADYSKCLNYADDQLAGASATAFWDISKPFLVGAGGGIYYGYSEELSIDIYGSGKYRLKEYQSIYPFIQVDLGSAFVFTFSDYSVMANPKFGFEFPYYNGRFVASVGLRFDQIIDNGVSAFCIGFSLGYTFKK